MLYSFSVRLILEKLKNRIIQLAKVKDKGILGAFMLYQDDGDFEGFKARVTHKVLAPLRGSHEERAGNQTASSATTASFQPPSTAAGEQRNRGAQSHDVYMPIIIDLEQSNLLDE